MPNGRNSRALLPPSLCVSYTQTGVFRPIDPHQVQVEPLAAGNLCSSIRAKQSRFTYIVSSSRHAGLLVDSCQQGACCFLESVPEIGVVLIPAACESCQQRGHLRRGDEQVNMLAAAHGHTGDDCTCLIEYRRAASI